MNLYEFKHLKTLESKKGKIDIYLNPSENVMLTRPSGFIFSDLVKLDIDTLEELATKANKPMITLVDTSDTAFADPRNMFELKRIKQIKNLGEYVVYTPMLHVYILGNIAKYFVNQDKFIRNKQEFDQLLQEYSSR